MANISPETFRKISAYVADLPARVLVTLVHGIASASIIREIDSAEELILGAAREALGAKGDWGEVAGDPRGLAFHAFQPFIIDVTPAAKLRGRIEDTSIQRIWTELNRANVATPLAGLSTEAARDIADDPESIEERLKLMRPGVQAQLEALHERISGEPGARARLSAQIGGIRVADDLADLVRIAQLRPQLDAFADWMDDKAVTTRFATTLAAPASAELETFATADIVYPLALLIARCETPGSLLSILLTSEGSDDPEQLARSRYAVLVDLLLDELEVLTRRLDRLPTSAYADEIGPLVTRFHDISSGLSSSLDLDNASRWAKELGRHRSSVADTLREPLEALMGRLRRAIHPSAGGGVDIQEMDDALAGVELLATVKPMRNELALNDCVTRVDASVSDFVDTLAKAIPKQARTAEEGERVMLSRRFDMLVRAARPLFGEEYARLLRRSGDVAGLALDTEVANDAA